MSIGAVVTLKQISAGIGRKLICSSPLSLVSRIFEHLLQIIDLYRRTKNNKQGSDNERYSFERRDLF